MPVLQVKNLTKNFGGVQAVSDLTFDVNEGEILGLIGPNGAGKTTVFNLISGTFPADKGEIIFSGDHINGLKPHQVAQKRLVRTFQQTSLFKAMTVRENMIVAGHYRSRVSAFDAIFNFKKLKSKTLSQEEENNKILNRLGLIDFLEELPANLPYGHQKALGIALALASKPTLLLLDEPVAGMNPEETIRMMKILQDLRNEGITLLLVEHDMKMVMGICDRLVVISFGSKLTEGKPEEVKNDPVVIKAYLGSKKID